jgi:hypothetical protein
MTYLAASSKTLMLSVKVNSFGFLFSACWKLIMEKSAE